MAPCHIRASFPMKGSCSRRASEQNDVRFWRRDRLSFQLCYSRPNSLHTKSQTCVPQISFFLFLVDMPRFEARSTVLCLILLLLLLIHDAAACGCYGPTSCSLKGVQCNNGAFKYMNPTDPCVCDCCVSCNSVSSIYRTEPTAMRN